MIKDESDLQRFVSAQASSYARAWGEMQAGRKISHWMWYIFPQLSGLGRSPMAFHYGIRSLGEAQDFLAHPLLGARLREITALANEIRSGDPHGIFGSPDDLKFHSSMTLFDVAIAQEENVFRSALEKYFSGQQDKQTLDLLQRDQAITNERIEIAPRSKDSLK